MSQSTGERSGAAPAARIAPAPLPAHVVSALTADIRAAAARCLTSEERAGLTITIETDDGGHVVRIRGESDLVDRLERTLFPDDRPDGQAPATTIRQDRDRAETD